jgi:hypothetical protein
MSFQPTAVTSLYEYRPLRFELKTVGPQCHVQVRYKMDVYT